MKFLSPFILFIIIVGCATAQIDDFEDGDDLGWTHVDPLGGLGAGEIAAFSVEDGRYRISAKESPAPSQAGPARGASLRQDVLYEGSVFLSVDLSIPDPEVKQAVGFVIFVQPNPSLGTTSGYSLNYQPADNDLILNRLTGEVPTRLDLASLTEIAGESLRLVLVCENGNFIGKLFNTEDLLNPIATVAGMDTTYTSGTAGLFVFADRDDGTGTTDAIFDHYRANALIAPPIELVPTGGDNYELRWPEWAVHFSPEETLNLDSESWGSVIGSPVVSEGFFVLNRDFSAAPRSFFRLSRANE